MVTRSTTPRKFFSAPMGSCTGTTLRPNSLLHRFQRALEIGQLAVHPVDHDGARQLVLGAVVPDLFGHHLHAGRRVHHHQRRIGRNQRRARLVDERAVARRIQKIDLGLFAPGPPLAAHSA